MQQHQGFQRQGATQQPASQHYTHLKTSGNSGLVCLAVLCKGSQAIIMINHKEKLTGVKKPSQAPALTSACHIQNISMPKRKSLIRGLMAGIQIQESCVSIFFSGNLPRGFLRLINFRSRVYVLTLSVGQSVCTSLSSYPPPPRPFKLGSQF